VKTAVCLALALLTSCAATREAVMPIGTASRSADFGTYPLRRIGLLVPEGEGVDPEFLHALRDALASEIAAAKSYEIVPLEVGDTEDVGRLETAHTGRVRTGPVVALARRSSLDGLITTRVLELRPYAPVRLVLSIDLIAVETGLVTWTGSVRVDANDRDTRAAIRTWQGSVRGANENDRALDLLSPLRIAEFAAMQAAMLL
jgi:hypothetical protein